MAPTLIDYAEDLYIPVDPEAQGDGYPIDGDDGGENPLVAVITPGKRTKLMTIQECSEKLPEFYEYRHVYTIHAQCRARGLQFTFHPDAALTVGDRSYLFGPIVVFDTERNGRLVSLDWEQIEAAVSFFQSRKLVLRAIGMEVPVFRF